MKWRQSGIQAAVTAFEEQNREDEKKWFHYVSVGCYYTFSWHNKRD